MAEATPPRDVNMGIYWPFSDLPQQLTSVVPLPPPWDQTVGGGENVQSRAWKEHSGEDSYLADS